MNAISSVGKETACETRANRGNGESARSGFQGEEPNAVQLLCSDAPEISSKFGHGGARANSGGPRANSGGARDGSGRPPKQLERPISYLPLGPRWHVVQIAHGQEDAVTREMIDGESRSGYPHREPRDFCIPTLPEQRRDRRGKLEDISVPIISGYGFVQFDVANEDWADVLRIDGVVRLLTTRSGTPIPIRDIELAWLLATGERAKQALMRRGKLGHVAFEPGDELRVCDGPFTSFDATCITCDGDITRATVGIFGRDTVVTLPRTCFEKA